MSLGNRNSPLGSLFCFQRLTSCPICSSFVSITLQQYPGWVAPRCRGVKVILELHLRLAASRVAGVHNFSRWAANTNAQPPYSAPPRIEIPFPSQLSNLPTCNLKTFFSPLANLRRCLYPTRGGHYTTLDARSLTGSSCHLLHPVRGLSLFHDVPRSRARACSEDWWRRNGFPGRSGDSQSRATYPARTLGHGGDSHPDAHLHRLDYRMGQRAVRSRLGAASSSPRRLDGVGRSGNELHSDAYRGNRFAHGLAPGLAARRLVCRNAHRRHVLSESFVGHVQPASCDSSRRQHGDHVVHARKPRAALPGLDSRQSVRPFGPGRGVVCLPICLRASQGSCY